MRTAFFVSRSTQSRIVIIWRRAIVQVSRGVVIRGNIGTSNVRYAVEFMKVVGLAAQFALHLERTALVDPGIGISADATR